MQSLNKNGVSITQTPGEEKYVKCCLGAFRGQIYYQYDYRHTDGEHSAAVKVRFDHPHQWGDDLYNDVWAWGRKIDEFGTLHHLQLLEDKPDFQIMTVVFGEPISRIDRSVFADVDTWGVCSLQGWVNSYESVRFVAINDHTAIITGEYNMEQVNVWLEKYTSIKSLKTS